MSLGFEMAGFDVMAAVEYDPVHAATHTYNFPHAPVICRDVRRVSAVDIVHAVREGWSRRNGSLPWSGEIDVVVGGPSCQGFSTMGKQDIDDDRNELVSEFVRLVEDLKPKAFVMENVPGILDRRFAPLLDDAVRRLSAAGYEIGDYSKPLNAVDFGVPQRRRRVFIVGVLAGYVLEPVSESDLGVVTAADALAGLPPMGSRSRSDGELYEMTEEQAQVYRSNLASPYLTALHEYGSERGIALAGALSGCLATEHAVASENRFAKVPQGQTDTVSRLWRIDESKPSRTLRAGTGSERGSFSAARPLHPNESRVITVREAARLHSFPDWFRFHSTNWHGHRQIGNSVPPLMAKAVATAVRRALGVIPVVGQPFESQADPALLQMSATQAKAYFAADAMDIPAKRRRAVRRQRLAHSESTLSAIIT